MTSSLHPSNIPCPFINADKARALTDKHCIYTHIWNEPQLDATKTLTTRCNATGSQRLKDVTSDLVHSPWDPHWRQRVLLPIRRRRSEITRWRSARPGLFRDEVLFWHECGFTGHRCARDIHIAQETRCTSLACTEILWIYGLSLSTRMSGQVCLFRVRFQLERSAPVSGNLFMRVPAYGQYRYRARADTLKDMAWPSVFDSRAVMHRNQTWHAGSPKRWRMFLYIFVQNPNSRNGNILPKKIQAQEAVFRKTQLGCVRPVEIDTRSRTAIPTDKAGTKEYLSGKCGPRKFTPIPGLPFRRTRQDQ